MAIVYDTPVVIEEGKPLPRLLRVPEVAQILSVSEDLVERLVLRGELPALKFGRLTRIRPATLERFINEREAQG